MSRYEHDGNCGDYCDECYEAGWDDGYESSRRAYRKSTGGSSSTQSSDGCYVATCVYGSYDCPQVWTLRRFRDLTLGQTALGKAFIRTYYAVSPTIVKWFGKTAWFKNMWRGVLDKMVQKLHDNGVEDTPYCDRNWRGGKKHGH